eukprot:Partr_v1_DN27884_c1_g1_i4_m22441 putative rho GTPase
MLSQPSQPQLQRPPIPDYYTGVKVGQQSSTIDDRSSANDSGEGLLRSSTVKSSRKALTKTSSADIPEISGFDSDPAPVGVSREDQSIVQFLCDKPAGIDWMLERLKHSHIVSKDVANYLKKRAAIEEEYGKQMRKLAATMSLSPETHAVVQTSQFADAWAQLQTVTEKSGIQRQQFAADTRLVDDEYAASSRNTDRSRKQVKESVAKLRKQMQEAEGQVEKHRAKYDASHEELNRVREGDRARAYQFQEPSRNKSILGRSVFNKKERSEEDCWARTNEARDHLNHHIDIARTLETEFNSSHIPHFINTLKEASDESDAALLTVMLKHLTEFEEAVLYDAQLLAPLDPGSVKSVFAKYSGSVDLKNYIAAMSNRAPAVSNKVGSNLELEPALEGHSSASLPRATRVFGRPLEELWNDNEGDVPRIVKVLVEVIQKNGMKTEGLYKVNAPSSRLTLLRDLLDKSPSKSTLNTQEWLGDMIAVASCLKLFLKELPEPLLTFELAPSFLRAAA